VADKLHEDDLQLVSNGHDEPVVIAFDVEDHATVLEHAGAAVLCLDGLSVGWKPVILVLLETLFLAGLYFGLLRLMAAQG
jgi:hypothetical protein